MDRAFRLLVARFVAMSVSAGMSLGPHLAAACSNSIALDENDDVILLVGAEDDLEGGKPGAAVQRVLSRFPDLKSFDGENRLAWRARRILATAILRMDGLLAVRGFEASTNAERRANLEWSVAVLRSIDRRVKNSPIVRAELAEALSTLPEHQQEAFGILEELAWRDVMPSPYAYRALARLRRLVGDEAGERDALKGAARLSRPPPPPPSDPAAWGFEVPLPMDAQPVADAPKNYGVTFRRAHRR